MDNVVLGRVDESALARTCCAVRASGFAAAANNGGQFPSAALRAAGLPPRAPPAPQRAARRGGRAPLVAALLVATVAATVSSTWGCAAHVVLPPPPPPGSSEELRAAYFEQNRAEPVERGQLVPRARMFSRTPSFVQTSLVLKNGAQVRHVEDLRPLVADGSLAAQAIDVAAGKSGEARTINVAAGVTSGLGALVGVGALAAGILGVDTSFLPPLRLGETDDNGVPDDAFIVPGYIVWGGGSALLTLVAGTGLAVWGATVEDDAAHARHEAFVAFDDGLRARLGLPPSGAAREAAPSGPAIGPEIAPEGAATQPLAPLEAPASDEPFETPALDVTPPE